MSETSNEDTGSTQRIEPEVGLIADEDLPEDLQPTDDNPLAQDPEDQDGDEEKPEKVEGMPDVGNPAGG